MAPLLAFTYNYTCESWETGEHFGKFGNFLQSEACVMVKPFGEFLSNLRTSAGVSLEDLALLAGSSKSTLSRLENDEVPRPFKGTVRKLIITLAEILCTSSRESERYLELAGINRALLAE